MLSGKCLHEIFAATALEVPDRIAVTDGEREITYAELAVRARDLACHLRRLGAGPETLVGLCAGRGVESVVGLLGVLEAGAAYLPVDPAYPAERVRFLLEDAGARVVVADPEAARLLPATGAAVVTVDAGTAEPAPPPAAPAGAPMPAGDRHLAYVIYTSGSTGRPKGVPVEHRNVVRLFERTRDLFGFGPDDVWTLFHSISFDFSVWEVWGALLFGGRLAIVPAEVARSPERFAALLDEQRVTVLSQTPSAFHPLIEAGLRDDSEGRPRWPDLRWIVFGGEALDVGLLGRWLERRGDERPGLVNMYGITETTVHVTHRRIRRSDLERAAASPIGAPLADLTLALIGGDGRELSNGAAGELLVAGAGVARGYLGRPRLTAERFVPAASAGEPGARAYRSGDRAVRLPDGGFGYLGRIDDQLKVRGFRIEPGEVEACLAAHPGVARAVAAPLDCGGGDVRLIAWVVPANGDGDLAARLARRAAEALPAWMRPSEIRVVAELPTTPHGKVDRRALALAAAAAPVPAPPPAAGPPAAAAASPTERTILGFAEEVLRRGGIAPGDDLFDLGATSLAFVRILNRTNHAFGVSLNGSELGDEATVARLALCVEAAIASHPHNPENLHAGHRDVELRP